MDASAIIEYFAPLRVWVEFMGVYQPHCLALVLLLEPLLQRREVLEDRASRPSARSPVSLDSASGHGLLAPSASIVSKLRAGRLVAVDRALVQRPGVAGRLAQRAVELELEDRARGSSACTATFAGTWYFAPGSKSASRARAPAARRPGTCGAAPTSAVL